jgi:hypothetical protein
MWSLLRFEKVAEFGNLSCGFDDFVKLGITFSEIRVNLRGFIASASEEFNSSSPTQALST